MFVAIVFSEAGPNTELGWLLWAALVFFFLVIVVGWLVSRNQKTEEAPVHVTHAAGPAHEDDLEIIEGIGPKVAAVLKGAGIHSFADLANAQAAHVEGILKSAGLNMMSAEGWIEQARLAADGDMEGLKKLQDELKGGRRK